MNRVGCLTVILCLAFVIILGVTVLAEGNGEAETVLSGADLVGTKPIPWNKLAIPAIAAVVFVVVGYAVRNRKKK